MFSVTDLPTTITTSSPARAGAAKPIRTRRNAAAVTALRKTDTSP